MNSKLFEKYAKSLDSQNVISGLLIAQAICNRKLIESFDNNCHSVVLSIIQEIVESIEFIRKENE